jgi:hypothetical protein
VNARPLDIGAVSLRHTERALLAGGVEAGKSTLEEALITDFYFRYPTSLILIVDSKPRFRAQYELDGRTTTRRYKRWDHGPTVPGSVVIERPEQVADAFKFHRVVVVQAQGSHTFPLLVGAAERFYDMARARRPQLLAVDETMDFFRINGAPIGGDALIRSARSGRELGLAALYCSQRCRGIPTQIMEYLEKLYAFRLDYSADLKRIYEMGAPQDLVLPGEKREFTYWTKQAYSTTYGPYMLDLGAPVPAGVTPIELSYPTPRAPASSAPTRSQWARRRGA